MGWFWNRSKKGPWELGSRTVPWGDKRSIYAHISGHISSDTKRLTQDGELLPDENPDAQIRFGAGAMDGLLGGTGAESTAKVTRLHRAIAKELENATSATLKQLYDELLDGAALEYVDPLLEAVANDRSIDRGRLHTLAVWLAKEAPDRDPVKVALALSGLLANEGDRELLLTLGRHDEFTLYATVALLRLRNGERNVFELAQHVDGWGRIQIVQRLADTTDPQIKKWMLREGYKNSIMYEYLAYTCAVAGGLRTELSKDAVDPELIDAAGDLIHALITGGPAEDMNDYDDGARVAELYLRQLGPSPRKLQQLLVADALLRLLDEKHDWSARAAKGWTTELRAKLREQCMKVKSLDHWPSLIHEGLLSKDRVVFGEADQAARLLGIDTWNEHFARLQAGDDNGWYFVMQTDDPGRIDRVVALAEERIPLQTVAGGPREEFGLGPAWAHHSHLDFVLQDLRRFPGKGWPLIRAGIRSPVVRNRHMALRAFSKWGKDRWPSDASDLLATALKEEPDESVRSKLQTVLAGNVIEDPKVNVPPQD
jgi:hypothetical protein